MLVLGLGLEQRVVFFLDDSQEAIEAFGPVFAQWERKGLDVWYAGYAHIGKGELKIPNLNHWGRKWT